MVWGLNLCNLGDSYEYQKDMLWSKKKKKKKKKKSI